MSKFDFPFQSHDPAQQANLDALKLYLDSLQSVIDFGGIATLIRLTQSGAVTVQNSGSEWAATFDTVDEDTFGTTNLNATHTLAGTASKTSGLATLTGTSTTWDTPSAYTPMAGSQIVVGGETRTVLSVTDDTHLTVTANWGATASGQTVDLKLTDRFVIPQAGVWAAWVRVYWGTTGGGDVREVSVIQTPGTYILTDDRPPIASGLNIAPSSRPFRAAVGDVFQLRLYQNSGGALTIGTNCIHIAYARLGA